MIRLSMNRRLVILAVLIAFSLLLSCPGTQQAMQDVGAAAPDMSNHEGNWVSADLLEGPIVYNDLEDYVDQLSDLHNESDIGTHSNPAAMRFLDAVYNTLTSDNITIPEQTIYDPENETEPYNQSAYESWRLDLEGGWTNVDHDEISAELCVFGGTQAEESLRVDIWDNEGWINVIPDVMPGWNNVSIAPSLMDKTLEMRFTITNGDNTSIQNSWDIDAVLLHTWTIVYGSEFTQNGIVQDLGNGLSRYIASVGETNTWNEVNGTWHRYLYDPDAKVVKIGNLTITHLPGGALSIDGDAGTRVGKLSWYIQAYYADQWNNITLDNYQFVGFTKTADNVTAHQRFRGTQGEMNVYLTYSYFRGFKTRVDIRNDAAQAVPIRAIWAARDVSGIQDNYELLHDKNDVLYGIRIEDATFSWYDVIVSDNPLPTQTVIDRPNRRAAVVFGNQSTVIPSGYTASIDPTYDVGADADDNYWNVWDAPVRYDGANDNKIQTDGATYTYVTTFRMPLTIVPYSIVTYAYLIVEVSAESGTDAVTIKRIDALSAGVLEGASYPNIDAVPTGTLLISATGSKMSGNIGKLVQEQINQAGWTGSSQYIGFKVEPTGVCGHTIEDYQKGGTPPRLSVTYLAPDDGWLLGYAYRQGHSISKSTGAGGDYQVKIHVEYGSGTSEDGTIYCNEHCDTDFDDIRFTDNDAEIELDYWMEEKTDSDDATFWVEVKDGLDFDQVIYCYYGKSGDSTTSSGTATFPFFEDWASGDLNTDLWTVQATDGSISWSVTDATHGYVMKLQGNAGAYRYAFDGDVEFGEYHSIRMRTKSELTLASHQITQVGWYTWGETWQAHLKSYQGTSHQLYVKDDDGNGADGDNPIATGYFGTYQTYDIHRGATNVVLVSDGVTVITVNKDPDAGDCAVGMYCRDSEKDLYNDWVFVRKYRDTEPAHHTWGTEEEPPNYAPTNDGTPTIATLDDYDKIYPQYRLYEVTTYYKDLDGFTDIDYVQFYVYNDVRDILYFYGRFDQDTHVFSEEDSEGGSKANWQLTGSTYSEHNTYELDVTWKFYVEWECSDVVNMDVRSYVIDDEPESANNYYETIWDIEPDLVYRTVPTVTSDDTGTVDRGDLNEAFHITGDISYVESSLIPPSSAIDFMVAVTAGGYGSNVGPWEDDTVDANGEFDVTCYADDEVGIETYTVKVVSEGAGYSGTDLIDGADPQDTYIADKTVIQTTVSSDAENRLDIDGNVEIRVTARLAYTTGGEVWLGAGDTITLDGVSMSWDSVNSWWELTRSQASVDKWNYYVNSSSETGHGVTGLDLNDKNVEVIWDRAVFTLEVNMTWTVIGYYANVSWTSIYDYNDDPYLGTEVINNNGGILTFSTVGNRTFYVTSIDDSAGYGLTEFTTNTVWCIWDDIVPSGSVDYYWTTPVSPNLDSVNLIWGAVSNWEWDYNGTLNRAVIFTSFSNGSAPSGSGGTYGSGAFGGLTTGLYNGIVWNYVEFSINATVTIAGIPYDWEIWSAGMIVVVPHSLITSVWFFYKDGDYYQLLMHTNYENASVMVWDDMEVGGGYDDSIYYGDYEGMHEWLRDTTVGTHNCTILLNAGADKGAVARNYVTNDLRLWYNFTYAIAEPLAYDCHIVILDTLFEIIPFDTFEVYKNNTQIYRDIIRVVDGNAYKITVKNRYGDTVNETTFNADCEMVVFVNVYSLKFMSWYDGFCEVNISRSGVSYTEIIMPLEIVNFKLYPAQYVYVIDYLNGTVSADYNINLSNSTGVIITGNTIADIMAMSEELWDLVYNVNVTITATNNYVLTISIDLENMNTTIGYQLIQVLLNITNTNTTIYSQVVDLLAYLQNVNSTLFDQTVDIIIELNYISSNVTAGFISVSAELSAIDSNLYSNFTSVAAQLLLIDSNLLSNFTEVSAALLAIDSSLLSNFTSVVSQLLSVNSSITSQFITVVAYAVELNATIYLVDDPTHLNPLVLGYSLSDDYCDFTIVSTWHNATLSFYDNDVLRAGPTSELLCPIRYPLLGTSGTHNLSVFVDGGNDSFWYNISYTVAEIIAFELEDWDVIPLFGVESYLILSFDTTWGNSTTYVYLNGSLQTSIPEQAGGVSSVLWMSGISGLHNYVFNITSGTNVITITWDFYLPDWAETGLVVRWDLWTFQDNYTMITLESNWMNCTHYVYLNGSLVATSYNDPVTLNFTRSMNEGTYNLTIHACGGNQNYTIKNIRYIVTEEGVFYDFSSVTGGVTYVEGDTYEGDVTIYENPKGWFMDQETAAIISVGGFLIIFLAFLTAREIKQRDREKTEAQYSH